MSFSMVTDGGMQMVTPIAAQTIYCDEASTIHECVADMASSQVLSSGFSNFKTYSSGDVLTLCGTASACDSIILSGGKIIASSGGWIDNAAVHYGGYLSVGSGGRATTLYLSSGGTISATGNAIVDSLHISSGAKAFFSGGVQLQLIHVSSGGNLHLSSGINYSSGLNIKGGTVSVYNGASIAEVLLSSGKLAIASGGTAKSIHMSSGTTLNVYQGGVAIRPSLMGRLATCTMNIYGGVLSSATLYRYTADIYSGGTARDISVSTRGILRVRSGSLASNVQIGQDGSMIVFDNGRGRNITVSSGGNLEIYANNTVLNTVTVSSGGYLQGFSLGEIRSFSSISGGVINLYDNVTIRKYNMIVSSGSRIAELGAGVSSAVMRLSSGANLAKLNMLNSARCYIGSGATVSFATITSGASVYISNGVVNSGEVHHLGKVFISNSGGASHLTISSGGEVYVSSGGSVIMPTVTDGGTLNLIKGNALYANINSNGSCTVLGGNVLSTTVISGDLRLNSAAATNTKLMAGAKCYLFTEARANSTEIISAILVVSNGAVASDTVVQLNGGLYVDSGAKVFDTVVRNQGVMYVSLGIASKTEIQNQGVMSVYMHASAVDTVISSGGSMMLQNGYASRTTVSSGGTLSCNVDAYCYGLQVESGAKVTINGNLVYDLAHYAHSNDAIVTGYSYIDKIANSYINLSKQDAPDRGSYKLAEDAQNFTGSISFRYNGRHVGTISLDKDLIIEDDVGLSLKLTDNGDLMFTVKGLEDEPEVENSLYVAGNFSGAGGVFTFTESGKGYVSNTSGSIEVTGTLDFNKWEILGVGDFNKSGADGLLWCEKDIGYVYMHNDLSSFTELTNKTNCLGVIGKDYSILGTGDFTGTGISGALLQGPAFGDASISLNYGLPIWGREADGSTFNGWLGALVNTWQPGDPLKGNTNDLADVNAQNYMYKVVSIGDYNGDGVDDVMLQNIMPTSVNGVTITGSGDVFTFLTGDINAVKVGASPTVAYAGCATGGWNIIGSGDFDGDGIDDTLLSDGIGLAGWKMAHGQQVGNQWFGNLDSNQSVQGIADFNNDGTDDLLIYNSVSGDLSAWLVNNGSVTGAVAIA